MFINSFICNKLTSTRNKKVKKLTIFSFCLQLKQTVYVCKYELNVKKIYNKQMYMILYKANIDWVFQLGNYAVS